MTYKSFEDLPVWQEAARLYERTDDSIQHAPPELHSSFRNQSERAVLSVSNNIAEGFERGTTDELLQFIYIGRATNCSRQLRGWADSLQNSEIMGQRHLNTAARRQYDQKQRAVAMQNDSWNSCPQVIHCAANNPKFEIFEISNLKSKPFYDRAHQPGPDEYSSARSTQNNISNHSILH